MVVDAHALLKVAAAVVLFLDGAACNDGDAVHIAAYHFVEEEASCRGICIKGAQLLQNLQQFVFFAEAA